MCYSAMPPDCMEGFNAFSTDPTGHSQEPLSHESLGLPTWDKPAQWDRITLTPNIEIHARRSLEKDERFALRKLLAYAGTIFTEETS